MRFHNTEFHETKRERKYYERKKQKALRYIDHTIEMFQYIRNREEQQDIFKRYKQKLTIIRNMVNDI